jgi:DNA-binding HxlR family transcriptional regulator
MAGKRSYGEACAAAHALDLVGERWALLVVRELMLGPKRFTDLRGGMPHASPNVLSQRLRELEEVGVVRRRTLAPPAASKVYELTEWGLELEPVIVSLGRWGSRSPLRTPGPDFSPDSLAVALRAMFDPDSAGDLEARYEIRLGDEVFRAGVADGQFEIVRGSADAPDAVVTTTVPALGSLVFEGRSLAEVKRTAEIEIEGSTPLVNRFLGLFPMPELAPVPVTTAA